MNTTNGSRGSEMTRFDWFFECLMELEGGYVNDPADHGGETKYGISKANYPNEDIKHLTKERAKEIYKRDYYDKFRIEKIREEPLAFLVFQQIVVSGYNGSKLLQNLIDCIPDGIIGPVTLNRVNNYLANEYADTCMDYFRRIANANPDQRRFLAGWLGRIKRSKEFFNVT